jgi:1,4-dihydroxy-6-naphthoate synthase
LKKITIAHSPDADDIFMYYAIKFGWIGMEGYQFENLGLDIETLNVEALRGTYDISAISFGLFPKIREDFALLNSAVSFGEGYGPKLIKLKDKRLKRNFRVALSGENTTNALLFKIAYPDARVEYMNFLEIEDAVISGKVDAGVLIHESILNFSDKLEVEKEIWDIWLELNGGKELPLPLGGMAIRRSFPLNRAVEFQKLIIDAVRVAVKNRVTLSKMLLERDLVRIDEVELEKYLSLYANDHSIELSDIQIEALDRLYQIGFENGFFDEPIKTADYMIPTDYSELR